MVMPSWIFIAYSFWWLAFKTLWTQYLSGDDAPRARPVGLDVHQVNESCPCNHSDPCAPPHTSTLRYFCPWNFVSRDSPLEFFSTTFSIVLRIYWLSVIALSNNKSGNYYKIQMKQPFTLSGLNCYLKTCNWKSAPKIHLPMSWNQKHIFSLSLL